MLFVCVLQDYSWDIDSAYNCNNPLANIAEMHKRVRAKNEERDAQKKQEDHDHRAEVKSAREKKKAERDKRAADAKKKKNAKEFEQPIGLSFFSSLFNGIQVNIKHIHIRYEDDYFSMSRPFSMGFLIDEIDFGNTTSHWTFHTANGMRFTRHKNDYVNKELNMARMRLYFNSFSEMLIPTSVWEQTKNEKLEIFSCMEATEIKDIMTSVFLDEANTGSAEVGINHHNLLEPFYINVAINMNNMYNPTYKQELFKYQTTCLVSKLILTTTPDLCRDMMQFVSYAETFSYVEDLKKFRPTMRLQAFIEYRESQGGTLSP